MKILYLSVHEILEYLELKLLTDLGYEVYSPWGAYAYPFGDEGRKRPGINNMHKDQAFASRVKELALQCTPENILPELLDMFDVVICMHMPDRLLMNWSKLQGRRVIFRSIGQNVQHNEHQLAIMRSSGLEIVRYSPYESRIPGYVGSDADIRFSLDPEVYKGWHGSDPVAVNFTQSARQRGTHCGIEIFDYVASKIPFRLYGPGNDDESYSGGLVSFSDQLDILRRSRVYVYTGTHPASYTLNFMEAWMTGIPVIAIGNELGNPKRSGYNQETYEVADLIEHRVTGYVAEDAYTVAEIAKELLEDQFAGTAVSFNGRQRAKELFSDAVVGEQWREYLG